MSVSCEKDELTDYLYKQWKHGNKHYVYHQLEGRSQSTLLKFYNRLTSYDKINYRLYAEQFE